MQKIIFRYKDIFLVKENDNKYVIDKINNLNISEDDFILSNFLFNDKEECYKYIVDVRFFDLMNGFKYGIYFNMFKSFKECYERFDEVLINIFTENKEDINILKKLEKFYLILNNKVRLDINRVKMYNNRIEIKNDITYHFFNEKLKVIPSLILKEGLLYMSIDNLKREKYKENDELFNFLNNKDICVNYINNYNIYFKEKI